MPSLKMSLGLKIRSKVNWGQNNNKIDKHSFLMSSSDNMIPIKCTKLSKMSLRYILHLTHILDKN